jgi:hypothetical protein
MAFLAAEAKEPVQLLVIEDGMRVAHNRSHCSHPQSADWMGEQLGAPARSAEAKIVDGRSGSAG